MVADVALIGGTGIGSRLLALPGRDLHIPTPYGLVSGRTLTRGKSKVLLLSRHGRGHTVPPHAVSYRGLAYAAAALQVRACIASAAVGSANPEMPEGSIIILSDFVDLSSRQVTRFSSQVHHQDVTQPFDPLVRLALSQTARDRKVDVKIAGVYVQANGPRYETPQEIEVAAGIGDVVGMTAASEAIAMKERGIPYGCLALVTNMAAGMSDKELDHLDVVHSMEQAGAKMAELMLDACTRIG